MDLKQKVIVVTGGARGLGMAAAQAVGQRGARVALVDVNAEALDAAVAKLAEQDIEAKAYVADIADEAAVKRLMDQVGEDMGPLDGLVNNAGITRDALLVKVKDGEVLKTMSLEQWEQVMRVNLTGTFLCGREAAVRMIEAGKGGVIINISSVSRHGNMGQTNYSATKAGVEAMAVTWAKELARYKIRCASIAPGYIGTEMVLSMKPAALEKVAAGIPAKRLGEPSEIASAVRFIFENDYMNGRCLEVDGALRI